MSSNIFYNDSSSALQIGEIKNKNFPQSKIKFITIVIIVGIIIIIIAVVLLAVLLSRKDKNHKIVKSSGENKQSIELVIEGYQDSNKGRNLQDNERKVKILGESFHELNSSNAKIYIDGKKIDFNESLDIDIRYKVRNRIIR